jgi:transketolase
MTPIDPNTLKELQAKAKHIRRLIIAMLTKAGSGHPGGSLSATDLLTALFYSVLRHNPREPKWPDRDRFHLSKGHCCPVLYAILADTGYFPLEHLDTLRKIGSTLQGHPDPRTPGIDVGSGSLGQGLSVAMGMALAARVDKKSYRVYVLMGDGELQEGNVWEAAMAAAHFKTDNLCAIVDRNGFQIDGPTREVMSVEPLAAKWSGFGWHTIEIDGHDMGQILDAYALAADVKGKPSVIIARTVKGKGVSFMEHSLDFHGRSPTQEEFERAMKELA